tara:strand:+ start:62 stop:502 length:441 start_codon:yes stop_codon:yes gene_type:complete
MNALVFALFLEHIMSLNPCYLCMIQRYAYCVTLILSILAFIYQFRIYLSILICLSMFGTVGIAAWHLGVELHWWLPSSSCAILETNIGSFTEELQNDLLESTSSGCDIMSPKFFGITLVQWSFVYIIVNTLFITILTYKQFTKNYG